MGLIGNGYILFDIIIMIFVSFNFVQSLKLMLKSKKKEIENINLIVKNYDLLDKKIDTIFNTLIKKVDMLEREIMKNG